MNKILTVIVVILIIFLILHETCNARVLPGNASIFTTNVLPIEQLAASIGNGYIGMIVGTQPQSKYMFVNGVWNGVDKSEEGNTSLQESHKAKIPNTNYISLQFMNYNENDINITYKLDVNNAIFSFVYTHKQNYWSVEQMIYTHRLYRNLVVTQINVNINNNKVNNLVIKVNNLNYNTKSNDVNMTDVTSKHTFCNDNNYLCFLGWTQLSETNASLIQIGVLTLKNSTNSSILNVSKFNSTDSFYYPSLILTSLESNDIINDMINMLNNDLLPIQNQWLTQHIYEWEINIWSQGRIDVITFDNNISMSMNIYSSIYYIISSIRNDWCFGISPGSIATNGYNGRVFWDEEGWIFPSLLLLHNTLSNCQLMYRYNTLNTAYINGKMAGYTNSAKYAWQSASTGIEMVPNTAPGYNSLIINAAIAWAINKYYDVTSNQTWLKDIGMPMLFGMSNYWIERVNKLSDTNNPGMYGYLNVTGADQKHKDVNNSGLTNMVAIESLNYSIKAANILNISYPRHWNKINYNNILILYDSRNKYNPEYEGYQINESIVQPGIIYFGYPYNYFYNTNQNKELYLNNLNIYYHSSSTHHTMQWSMFMINYMILNQYNLAMDSFFKTLLSLTHINDINDTNPFKVWTEGSDGSGCDHFVTDIGGFIQTFLFGFGGLNIHNNYLRINIQFMPYKQMDFIGIDYQNNHINFSIYNVSQTNIIVNITVTECNDINKYLLLILYDNDTKNHTLKINQTVSVSNAMQPAKILKQTTQNNI